MEAPSKKISLSKRIIYLAVGIIVPIFGYAAITQYLKETTLPPKAAGTLHVATHNTADVQNNPVEYESVMELFAKKSGDKKMRKAGAKTLAVSKTYNETRKVKDILDSALLEEVMGNFLSNTPIAKGKGKGKDMVANFLDKYGDMPLVEVLKEVKFGSAVDKSLREINGTRFAIVHCDSALIERFKKKEAISPKEFVTEWSNVLNPYSRRLYMMAKKSGKVEDFPEYLLLTFLFDYTSTSLVFEKAREAWVTVAESFKESTLFDRQKKAEMLRDMYLAQDLDIICLQEADASLVAALYEKGYFAVKQNGEAATYDKKQGSVGSIILYKKKVFRPSSIQVLRSTGVELAKAAEANPDVSKKNLNKLLTKELSIQYVTKDNQIWLISSFHANTDGENALAGLHLIALAKERLLQKHPEKEVITIIGMDSNTTHKKEPGVPKRPIATVDALAKELGLKRVQQKGKDIATTNKCRSCLQPQFGKAGLKSQGISDCLLLSAEQTTTLGTYMSPHGPNIETAISKANPSDHKLVVVAFKIKAVAQSKKEVKEEGGQQKKAA